MTPRWLARLLFLMLIVLVAVVFWQVQVKTDLSAFLVAGDSAEEILLASEMQSGKLSRRYILSIGSSNAKISDIKAFSAEYASLLRKLSGVANVWQPTSDSRFMDEVIALYLPHYSQIYSLRPEVDLKSLFYPDALHRRAGQLRLALLSPQSQAVKKIAKLDPLLLSLNTFAGIADRFKSEKNDDRYITLILETQGSGLDFMAQEPIQADIKRIFNEQNLREGGDYSLAFTGVPVFAVATRKLVSADIQRVTVISTLGLLILFIATFRSLNALFLVSLVLVSSVSVAVMSTAVVFGYIHGLTLALGTTLIGVCIDYPIHALVHGASVPVAQRTGIVARIWPSLLLGGLTTLVGYAALGLSGFPGFQQISVYAGSGILTSLLVTRYVLPGLMISDYGFGVPLKGMQVWIDWCGRWRRRLVLLLIIGLGIALSEIPNLHWINDLAQLTPELENLKKQDALIRSRTVSIEPGRFVLVQDWNVEAALNRAEWVYRRLDALKIKGVLENYYGLYPWMLSQKLQQRNEEALQAELTDKHIEWWRLALAQQKLSVDRLGQLALSTAPRFYPKDLLDSPLRHLVDGQFVQAKDRVLVIIWLAMHSPNAVKAGLAGLDGVTYFSQRDLLNQMAERYRNRAVTMLLAGSCIILFMLIIRYKSSITAGRILMPALVSALSILAGWAYSGNSLSFLHLVGFLLVIAICVDYGIFFSENRAGNKGLTYQAMAVSMLTSALAFGSLGFADSASLRALSGTVAFGVILGFLLCPILIRQHVEPSSPTN